MGERGGPRLPEGAHCSRDLSAWQVPPGMSDLARIFGHNCMARRRRYPLDIGCDGVKNSRQLRILAEFGGCGAAMADVVG
jgi:hypothetical protein